MIFSAALGLLSLTAWAAPSAPLLIAHRGLGAHGLQEPENSIPSLLGAFAQGAHAVEFDVQLTRDGEVVLAHDARLERVSDGQGCIAEHTLAELRSLRLKDGAGRLREDVFLPTLREALIALHQAEPPTGWVRPELVLDIHLKVYSGLAGDWPPPLVTHCPRTDYAKLARETLRIVTEEGWLPHTWFTSFHRGTLRTLESLDKEVHTGLLALAFPNLTRRRARSQFDAVVVQHPQLSAASTRKAHESELEVFAWTVNEREDIERVLALGVDGLITDRLGLCLSAHHW